MSFFAGLGAGLVIAFFAVLLCVERQEHDFSNRRMIEFERRETEVDKDDVEYHIKINGERAMRALHARDEVEWIGLGIKGDLWYLSDKGEEHRLTEWEDRCRS